MKLELNIFTNAHSYAPDTSLVEQTYNSFCDTFDPDRKIPVTVWCDPHPNKNKCTEYISRLKKLFLDENVHITTSLSDGYIKSIQMSDADYLFQLEGDWVFRKQWIDHDLSEILNFMADGQVYHFRFNKRPNVCAGWDKKMEHYFCGNTNKNIFRWCESNNLSNNPHIIDRKRYADDLIKHIKNVPSSKGIEENLNAVGNLVSHVYGGLNHPATVEHLDGRKLERQRRRTGRRVRLV